MADVSTWADEIRREQKSTSPLHYANIDPDSNRFNLERDCPQEGCVVSAIIKYSLVLRDKKAIRQEKIEALKFSSISWVTCVSLSYRAASQARPQAAQAQLLRMKAIATRAALLQAQQQKESEQAEANSKSDP